MKNINIPRILRLVFGILIILQAIDVKEWLLAIPGVFLLLLAALNTGCGAGGCTVPYKRNRHSTIDRMGNKIMK
ncbi:hypothetical protein DVK85_06275 [Flavobacterium arcticum]|uniref:DUF2892 domain-containing protein n=1 Tax=Flavobacterium arcticum TaxID=1784713 RepID=A0A345HBA6_9FLAO|nr:hypothetical protein [Flavobacterium arcticum]AXG73866.1 hypothetical protein DVK85_06275 [Flavobacterium arcticum]KAF2511819.1 hypothetical protein E0W72_05795 [Flavobacterium arcticum]